MHCNNIFKEGAMKIKRSRNFTSPGDRLKGHIAQFKYIISHSTYQPFLRINLLSLSLSQDIYLAVFILSKLKISQELNQQL